MCGIAGFIDNSLKRPEDVMKNMIDAIAHRGPDDEGLWHDRETGISLGHRRLSIIDLSRAGHQPMISTSGRYIVVFNGEIYNYRIIRAELEQLSAQNWRGHSDTEVMLEAFEAWGVEASVRKFIGMFAIAVWDRKERLLYIIRDRIGEKPLYYGLFGDSFIFGSELKALRMHPAFKKEIDRSSLALYMRYCYIPAPYTIYKGVNKLPPGTLVKIGMNEIKKHVLRTIPYWSAREIAADGLLNPVRQTEQETAKELEMLLLDAVNKQMIADVSLGAFLSGGVDSSVIVSLMQSQSSRPVKTFTIGFSDKKYDEALDAKKVACYLGTDHTELYVSPDDALEIIPTLPDIYDEPFGDSSQIPTSLVSKLTRQYVVVSLSGDAGDELFGGYNRYVWSNGVWNGISLTPLLIRRALAASIAAISPQSWDRVHDFLKPVLPHQLKQRILGDKMHKMAGMLDAGSYAEMYRHQVSTWKDTGIIIDDAPEPSTALTDNNNMLNTRDFVQQMMYLDLVSYLPDDILTKVDRASMSVSLETRVPFLDHRVVEFAWKLPLSLKIRNGQGKWILRQVLYKYLPKELVERPKMGFGVPIDAWLRGPLREWAEDLLSEDRLLKEGFLNPKPIRALWNEHLGGRRNWHHQLWNVLMFESWIEKTV